MKEALRASAITLALGVVAGLGCAPSPMAQTTPPPPAVYAFPADVSGTWTTQWGRAESCQLQLQQNGGSVSGSYTTTGAPPGVVDGTIDGNNVLTGSWSDEGGGGGGMQLQFSADGRSFSGTWGSGRSSTDGGSWTGSR